MGEEQLFFNKFEIPLTIFNPEGVFNNISGDGSSGHLDARLIASVYLPVHAEDGTSGRPFWYDLSRAGYYGLIERILLYKPVVVTYPQGEIPVMEKYLSLGVREFMVSKWSPGYGGLKARYPGLKISRSIVKNSFNDSIDKNFDSIIVPYRKMLNLEWLKEASQAVPLVAIINQYCRVRCTNLDKHLAKELQNTANVELKEFSCPGGRSYFLPRQVALKIRPYISAFKIVDRLLPCLDYEKHIKYYTGQEMLNEGDLGNDIISIKNFYERTVIHKLYPFSNLVNLDCEFQCEKCERKCF